MNDDDPSAILILLRAEHRLLDAQIEQLRLAGAADQMELARLKKRKLRLKDEIEHCPTASCPTLSPEPAARSSPGGTVAPTTRSRRVEQAFLPP